MYRVNENSKYFGDLFYSSDNDCSKGDKTVNRESSSEFKVDCKGFFARNTDNSNIVCGICDDNFKEMCSLEKHLLKEHWRQLSPISDDFSILDVAVENSLNTKSDLVEEANKSRSSSQPQIKVQSLIDDSSREIYKVKPNFDAQKLTSISEKYASCNASSTSYNLGTNSAKNRSCHCKPLKENISPENVALLFNNKAPLQTHICNVMDAEKHDDENYEDVDPGLFCEFCSLFFETKNEFYQHASQKHDRMPVALQSDPDYLRCDYCLKTFYEYSKRIAHQECFHHDTNEYECPHCPKMFKLRSNRNQHISEHHHVSVYWCDLCYVVFKQNLQLRKHMDKVHYKKLG